jgi:hypothetical protein
MNRPPLVRDSRFADGDLPPLPGSFWELVGPGAVLVGLAIGAGELIVWPRLTAAHGASMAWAAVLGIFIQTWLNLEIARYTLATGESVYTGYARLSPALPGVFLALNVCGWIVPGWARTCGGALKVLVVGPDGWGSPTAWTAITFAAVVAVLFGPKVMYRSLERTVEGCVILITVGLIVLALTLADASAWRELAAGIVNIPYRDPAMPRYELFAAIVFAGAGGTANLFYSYYVRDKGWGMGAHMPVVMNPLRGQAEKALAVGFRIRPNDTNRRLWRAWFRHLTFDQFGFFFCLNTLTILLFILGALAVLRPLGLVPNQELLVAQEAAILETTWGIGGKYAFLLIGVACLFSTQLTLIDGVSRSCADIIHTNFPRAQRYALSSWYVAIAVAWIAVGILLTYLYEAIPPILFLLSAGFFGGLAMAIYAPLTILINTRLLPEPFRPGRARIALLVLISAFYIVFALAATATLIGTSVGG